MRGEGRVFRRGAVYWIAYFVRGKEFRESGGRTEREALKKLKARLSEKHGDRFIGPAQERITVGDLLDAFLRHLERQEAKSLESVKSNVRAVRAFFGDLRAVDVTTETIERFIGVDRAPHPDARRKRGKAAATVNRDLAALRGAFHLARRQGQLSRVPYFPMLKEDNARQGFFEKSDFEAVAAALPPALGDVARFAFLSGWRKSEIVALTWENVDRAAGEVRIATSKNGHGRVLPLTGALRDLIEKRWEAREYKNAQKVTALSPYVFHHKGRPAGDFRKAWAAACAKANVPGRLFHDLRRTAVRNFIRAGVSQTVAMSITGHRTISVFNRYCIASDADRREALIRTEALLTAAPASRKVAAITAPGQKPDNGAPEGR